MKTEISSQVGIHVFEVAGLGKAPFRFVGMSEKVGPIEISPGCFAGSPGQPMGICDFCGQGIRYCCTILSSDGKTFTVGTDCVRKTGDTGLLRAYKNSPEVRAANRAKREAADGRVKSELKALLADEAVRQILGSNIPNAEWGNQTDALTMVEKSLPWCGMAGRAKNLRLIKRILAESKQAA